MSRPPLQLATVCGVHTPAGLHTQLPAGAAIAVGPVHAHRPDGGAPHVNAPSVGTQPKKLMKPPQSMPQPPQCCDVLVMSVGCNPVMKGLGQHRIAALEPTCVIAGRLAP
jgi:hypothetical protein